MVDNRPREGVEFRIHSSLSETPWPHLRSTFSCLVKLSWMNRRRLMGNLAVFPSCWSFSVRSASFTSVALRGWAYRSKGSVSPRSIPSRPPSTGGRRGLELHDGDLERTTSSPTSSSGSSPEASVWSDWVASGGEWGGEVRQPCGRHKLGCALHMQLFVARKMVLHCIRKSYTSYKQWISWIGVIYMLNVHNT